jgi:hypothetical protein
MKANPNAENGATIGLITKVARNIQKQPSIAGASTPKM